MFLKVFSAVEKSTREYVENNLLYRFIVCSSVMLFWPFLFLIIFSVLINRLFELLYFFSAATLLFYTIIFREEPFIYIYLLACLIWLSILLFGVFSFDLDLKKICKIQWYFSLIQAAFGGLFILGGVY